MVSIVAFIDLTSSLFVPGSSSFVGRCQDATVGACQALRKIPWYRFTVHLGRDLRHHPERCMVSDR